MEEFIKYENDKAIAMKGLEKSIWRRAMMELFGLSFAVGVSIGIIEAIIKNK